MNVSLPKEPAGVAGGAGRRRALCIDRRGLAVAVADLKALSEDDLAWAKPYVEKARDSIARVDVISGRSSFAA
jgi:hypothetical protein